MQTIVCSNVCLPFLELPVGVQRVNLTYIRLKTVARGDMPNTATDSQVNVMSL